MSLVSVPNAFIISLYLFAFLKICNPLSEILGTQQSLKLDDLQKALSIFDGTLKTVSIPDYNGKSGKLTYGLSSMKITSFDKPNITFDVDPSLIKVSLAAHVGHVVLQGKWRFKYRSWWPLRFSDNGRFKLKVNKIRFSLAAAIQTFNEAPKLSISDCQCNVNSVNLDLSGGGSWLYRLWNRKFETKITKELNDKVCDVNCKKIKKKHITI